MPILTIYTAYDMYHEKKLIRRRAKRKLDASQFEQCDAIIARVSPPLLDYGTKTQITFVDHDPEPSPSQIKIYFCIQHCIIARFITNVANKVQAHSSSVFCGPYLFSI
jgi:hypothetical protein